MSAKCSTQELTENADRTDGQIGSDQTAGQTEYRAADQCAASDEQVLFDLPVSQASGLLLQLFVALYRLLVGEHLDDRLLVKVDQGLWNVEQIGDLEDEHTHSGIVDAASDREEDESLDDRHARGGEQFLLLEQRDEVFRVTAFAVQQGEHRVLHLVGG